MVFGLSIPTLLIWIVGIFAAVALAKIALDYFEVKPPAWAIRAFWIVVIALVIIYAIKLVSGTL